MTGAAIRPAAPLLERDGELASIAAVLADAGRGEGRLLVVEGPAGIGKTRLLETARGLAADGGLVVLHARAGELEGDYAFGVVRQLLEPVLAGAGADGREELLSGAAGLAAAVLGDAPAGPAAGDPGHAALHGLYWLVVNLSERAPLLVAVDDLQWSDGPSLRFLHHLVRRLDGLPVAVVGCRRSGEEGTSPELLDALLLEAELVRPRALSGDAVEALVRGRLGDAAPAELCGACLESSRGNPFLLRELLWELADGGRDAGEIDPDGVRALGPARIATSVRLRLGRLGPDARALARALAVLGESAPLPVAAAMAGVEPDRAASLVDALTGLGVLAPGPPLGFTHPIVRTSLYRDIPAADREALHRRAAALLAGDPEQAAVHLLATEPAGDPATAETLAAAGRAAQARGATESALAILRRALAEPPAPSVRARVTEDLALGAHLQGQPDALALLEEALALAPDPVARARVAASLALRLRYAERDSARADAVLEDALRDDPGDPVLREVIEATLLDGFGGRGASGERRREARARVGAAPDDEVRMLLAAVAADRVLSGGTASEAADLAGRALGDGELVDLCVAMSLAFAHMAAIVLIWAERYTAAERALEGTVRGFRARGALVPAYNAEVWRGMIRHRRGDLAAAEAHTRPSLEEPAVATWTIPLVVAAAVMAEVLLERGRPDEARAAVDAMDAVGHDADAAPTQHLRAARARVLAAEGRHREALAELDGCARVERDLGLTTGLCPVAWRSQAALSHAALGEDTEARRLAAEEVDLARRFGAPGALGIALRAHALVHGGDEGTLREAVAALAGSEARLEHARALIDLGAALRRDGRRTDARAVLAEGTDLANRCGATVLVERGREELRLAGARPRRLAQAGRDGLTPAELRVAEAAAAGGTNKEIAQALFVTRRTVEIHLSNAYRKLGIEGREDLAGALSGTP